MKKIKVKSVYTYYNVNLRFKNDDAEDMKLFRKFKSIKAKSKTITELVKEYLREN